MKRHFFFSCLRRSLVAVVLALSSVPVMADDPVTLNIHLADGTIQSIQLYTRPQVTFEGDRVVFTSLVSSFSYDAQQVLRFTYSGGTLPDKVASPNSQAFFLQDGEQFTFDAKVKASDIQLFAEDGKRLPASIQTANGRPTLTITNLPAGVYMLSVNGLTSKFVKR